MELHKNRSGLFYNNSHQTNTTLALIKEVRNHLYHMEIKQASMLKNGYGILVLFRNIVRDISEFDSTFLFLLSTDTLRQKFNFCKKILKQLSSFKYKELLYMFSPEFNFNDQIIDSVDDITSTVALLLSEVYFDVENLDSVSGDDIVIIFQNNNSCEITRKFYKTFRCFTEELIERDETLLDKYSYKELLEDLDILL